MRSARSRCKHIRSLGSFVFALGCWAAGALPAAATPSSGASHVDWPTGQRPQLAGNRIDGGGALTMSTPQPTAPEPAPSPDQHRPYGPDGDRLIWNVRHELTRRCMAEAGFEYLVNPMPQSPPPDPTPRFTLELAQTEGYRQLLAADGWVAPQVSPDADLPGYSQALDPDDDDDIGCVEQAYVEIFGDSYGSTALDMFRAIDGGAIVFAVDSSPEVSKLLSEWSACMRSSGYEYANLGEVINQFIGPMAGPLEASPSSEEIQVAIADAECRDQIGYQRRYLEVYATHYDQWLFENEAQLREVALQAEVDLQRVREVASRLGM